jgi:hypothetical protein
VDVHLLDREFGGRRQFNLLAYQAVGREKQADAECHVERGSEDIWSTHFVYRNKHHGLDCLQPVLAYTGIYAQLQERFTIRPSASDDLVWLGLVNTQARYIIFTSAYHDSPPSSFTIDGIVYRGESQQDSIPLPRASAFAAAAA